MATTMLTAGVPVSVVAGRLGHARAATTLNVYTHFGDTGDRVIACTTSEPAIAGSLARSAVRTEVPFTRDPTPTGQAEDC